MKKYAPTEKDCLYLQRQTKERQITTDFFHNLYIVFPHHSPRLVGFFVLYGFLSLIAETCNFAKK